MAELFVSGGIVTALEQAAVAVGRLDAALAGNPLRQAWTFWSELGLSVTCVPKVPIWKALDFNGLR